jgi:hypothetical protein
MGTRAATVEHLWKQALLHLLLCFVMGFFTDFAPSSSSSWKAGPQPQLPHLAGDDTLAASHVPVSTRPPPPTDGVVVHVGDDDEDMASSTSPPPPMTCASSIRSARSADKLVEADEERDVGARLPKHVLHAAVLLLVAHLDVNLDGDDTAGGTPS